MANTAAIPALPTARGSSTHAPVNITFAELVAEGLSIQHRFAPEPIYARTGRGFLRPSGVSEIAEAKARERAAGIRPRG